MIFNYCIIGEVTNSPIPYTGTLTIYLYNETLEHVYIKQTNIEEGKKGEQLFQFNLGDRELFGINHKINSYSTAVIVVDNPELAGFPVGTKKFFRVKIDKTFIHEFNIDMSKNCVDSSTNANNAINNMDLLRIVTDKYFIKELDPNVYSYFAVTNAHGEIVYSANEVMEWIPRENGNYNILHRMYNQSTLEISEVIISVDVLENYIETTSIDYVFFGKRDKIVQLELPEYVLSTLILPNGFYIENGKVFGKIIGLTPIQMDYSRGKVVIKPQIGDILDY